MLSDEERGKLQQEAAVIQKRFPQLRGKDPAILLEKKKLVSRYENIRRMLAATEDTDQTQEPMEVMVEAERSGGTKHWHLAVLAVGMIGASFLSSAMTFWLFASKNGEVKTFEGTAEFSQIDVNKLRVIGSRGSVLAVLGEVDGEPSFALFDSLGNAVVSLKFSEGQSALLLSTGDGDSAVALAAGDSGAVLGLVVDGNTRMLLDTTQEEPNLQLLDANEKIVLELGVTGMSSPHSLSHPR